MTDLTSNITKAIVEYGAANIMARIPTMKRLSCGFANLKTQDFDHYENYAVTTRRDHPGKVNCFLHTEDYKVEFKSESGEFERYYCSDFDSLWKSRYVQVYTMSQHGDETFYTEIFPK